jgi:2-oxoisovalerate dehydrogenase E2 component (dihydrolipoyl transacylase)
VLTPVSTPTPAPSTTTVASSGPFSHPPALLLAEDKVTIYFITPDRLNIQVISLRGHARKMATTMTESLSIPHFGYCDEVDMTSLAKVTTHQHFAILSCLSVLSPPLLTLRSFEKI